jgi:hypothetical protein
VEATAPVEAFPRERSLSPIVHLSSERMVQPVRQDSSFAEKQESHPALPLLVVRREVARCE